MAIEADAVHPRVKKYVTATLDNLMQIGYSAAADLARGLGDVSAIRFKALLSDITEDSRRILSLVMRSETSPTISEETRNILSDFLSKTKVSPLSSKKSLSGESSANLTIDDTSGGKGEKHAAPGTCSCTKNR